jgi:methyl-accepting chemotaxis protein
VVRMTEGQQQVEAGVVTTSKAGESLGEIISAAQSVGDMILRISTAAGQQGSTARQINLNVEHIEKLTAESAEDANQSTKYCENLSELTRSLKEIISQFQFRQIISSGAHSAIEE